MHLDLKPRLLAFWIAWLGFLSLSAHLGAAEAASTAGGAIGDRVAAASDEGEQAIRKFRIPAGLKVELFAAEPMLANPVALDVDVNGRIFVAETFRHSAVGPAYRFYEGVFDVRSHMDWLEDDLSSRSVEDRVNMYRRHLAPPDFENLKRFSERVTLIEDRDGDGRADRSTVFADGFNQPADGIASGVLARGTNLYFTCIPNLWTLWDTDGDGKADGRRVMSTGYGVHVAFLGHDLHGLVFGPDGRLYFSIGDRGINVTNLEGRVLSYPDEGVVLRCEPDGRGLEVFHRGLRNPQELVFDAWGNLFTADNNSDGGDRARWVYLTEGGDSGWRVGYQHLTAPPRRGPWNGEQMWRPLHEGQPAWINPPIANLGYGPSGITVHPGTGLNDQYLGRFFVCDFRGGASSGVHAFTLKPRGAGYELASYDPFVFECLPTDCAFGPDGSFFFTDWVEGWTKTGKGRIYRVFDPSTAGSEPLRATQTYLKTGMKSRGAAELIALLAHQDARVRLEAQFELAGRGTNSFPALRDAALNSKSQFQRLHAIWAVGQLGRTAGIRSMRSGTWAWGDSLFEMTALLADADPEIRAQAGSLLAEAGFSDLPQFLPDLLSDESLRVRALVLLGVARNMRVSGGRGIERVATEGISVSEMAVRADPGLKQLPKLRNRNSRAGQRGLVPGAEFFETLSSHGASDPVIRHACTSILAVGRQENPSGASTGLLSEASNHASSVVRLAAVVAMRRTTNQAVALFLKDKDPLVCLEAARAIGDGMIDRAVPALAGTLEAPELLARLTAHDATLSDRARKAASGVEAAVSSVATETGSWTAVEQFYFRVLSANHRLGGRANALALARFAASSNAPTGLRSASLDALGDWNDASKLDRVTGLYHPRPSHDEGAAAAALRSSIDQILRTAPEAVKVHAIASAAKLRISEAEPVLFELVSASQDPAPRTGGSRMAGAMAAESALRALASLKSTRLPEAVRLALASVDAGLKREAMRLQADVDPDGAVTQFSQVLESGSLGDRQAAFQTLAGIRNPRRDVLIERWLEKLISGEVQPGLQLDLIEAASSGESAGVLAGLRRFEAARPKTALSGWAECIEGGNVEAGRRVFFERAELGCLKCHRVNGEGGDAGPDLTGVGRRQTREYFIESILFPNNQFAPGFENVLVVLKSGVSYAGLLKSETDSDLTINSPEDGLVTLKKSEITTRHRALSAMPEEFRQILGKRELRDLVEFLANLK